jgi:hypothetical protein
MKKQFIVEAQRLQKLAGINEARVVPGNNKLFTLKKYGFTGNDIQNIINIIADTKQEYFNEIDSNDILYRGFKETVDSPQVNNDIADSLIDIIEEDSSNDEENIVDTITDYTNIITHFRVMDNFAPQLVKNLLDAGFTYNKTEDEWTIPDDRYNNLSDIEKEMYDDKIATSYGIIWNFWGIDYDTSDREAVSDSLADAAQEYAGTNESKIIPTTSIAKPENLLNISLPDSWEVDSTDIGEEYYNPVDGVVIGYYERPYSYNIAWQNDYHLVIIFKFPNKKYMVRSDEVNAKVKDSEMFDSIEDAKAYAIKEMDRINNEEQPPEDYEEEPYYED